MSEIQEKEHQNLWILAAAGAFIGIISFIFFLFKGFGVTPLYSSISALVAGAFVVFIIMSINGILKQFSIKGPFFEMTSILKERIETVQTDVKESKREIGEKITSVETDAKESKREIGEKITSVQTDAKESKREIGEQITSLSHNIQSIHNRIDNVMASINISANTTQSAATARQDSRSTVNVNLAPAINTSPSEAIKKQEQHQEQIRQAIEENLGVKKLWKALEKAAKDEESDK